MLVDAFNYKLWADKRTLEAAALVDAAAYPTEHSFIRQQFNHMAIVEENFKARLLGIIEPHSQSNTETVPDLKTLIGRLNESRDWYRQYVAILKPEQLTEITRFTFVDGKRGRLSRQEILFHVINHGTYHRGAIGHALDIAGNLRPADTYTLYIHATEPERRFEPQSTATMC